MQIAIKISTSKRLRGFYFVGFFILYFFTISTPTFSQIKINEVLAINATKNYDPQYFNYPAWIELKNNGTTAVNIGGYYLSDSKTTLTKWVIPANTTIAANGYLLMWCDKMNSGLHTNYDIDADGEGIYLYSNSVSFIDSVRIPKQYSNVSFGRISNGINWGYLVIPTPAATNSTTSVIGEIVPPIFSLPSGRYASTQTLTLSSTILGTQTRYTIDGSEPTPSSTLYATTPITISKTTVIKAKTFSAYAVPSQTVTHTYFINEHTTNLPVVSISMDPAFLWDNTIGMYADGTNGIAGNCTEAPKNFNQDWGRYCVTELFTKDGKSEFKKDFEVKIYGACSRTFNGQKSLAFFARSEYGKGHLEYKLFPTKDIDKFDNYVLRNSGNDCNVTHFRDGLMQDIIRTNFDLDWMAYQPAAVYLNGSYWGIMNTREKLNENYIEHNAKIDADSIDYLEALLRVKDGNILLGSNADYLDFLSTLQTMNLSAQSAFDYIDSQMDVNEYINYYIAQVYYKNTDWPGNNVKFWKPAKKGGKWRWILFDTDFGFNDATHQTLHFVTDSTTTVDWPNPQWSTLLFRLLIKNPTFKNKFIQSFQTAISSTFEPARVNHKIDSISGLIAAEMAFHKVRWGGSIADWNNQVNNLRNFATARYNFMPGYIKSFFALNQQLVNFGVSANIPNAGNVLVNSINLASDTVQIYTSIPYTVKAIPSSGYKFKQWQIKSQTSNMQTLIVKGDTWKYNDSGTNLNTDWKNESYNDGTWLSGLAQFGYGDGDEASIVSYGSNAANKYITTYFRKTINIGDTSGFKTATIDLLCDDGAVIYINGVEAVRFNMPAGVVAYNTLAPTYATENIYTNYTINKGLFKTGNNTIAVEIHQNDVTSSDLSFDLELKLIRVSDGPEYTSTNSLITDTAETDLYYKAIFEPIAPVSELFINEIAATNTTLKDNYGNTDDWFEVYNGSNDTIDLAGLFLSDNFLNPTKFKIWSNGSTNHKILPLGYKVFWADEEEHQGNLHCSFKLSGTGERIGLFQVVGLDTIAIDTLTYGIQKDLFTWGRYPDGAQSFVFMITNTPNDINKYSTLSTPPLLDSNGQLTIYPNPAKEFVNINFPHNNGTVFYTIVNTIGKQVLSGELINNQIKTENLSRGIYLVKLSEGGKVYSAKLIIE